MTCKPLAPKVFIVDDDDAVRDALGMLLELHGLEVVVFAAVDEFAEELSQTKRRMPASRSTFTRYHRYRFP